MVAVVAASSHLAHAEGVEAFYQGRTVYIVVGNSAGGGYDLNARVLAQHMGNHIPGHPTLVVQNMPGAGSLKAANYMYSVAPKNGSVLGMISRSMVVEPLFTDQQYDGTKFAWIGSISRDVSTCMSWKTSPVKTWQDMIAGPYVAAGQGAGADADVFTATIKNLFGANVKLVAGFPGTNEMALAMERGEVDGFCGISYSTLKSRHAAWLRDKEITILVQIALEKEPELDGVPLITQFAKDSETLQMLRLIVAPQGMARPVMTSPGTPADRVAALRTAFDETMKDPDFLADAQRMEVDVSPMPGADLEALVKDLYATPKDIVAKAARAMAMP